MADYSKHADPAGEWIGLQKWLEQHQRTGSGNNNVRDTENRRREQLARNTLGRPADVRIDDISIPLRDGSTLPARLYRPTSSSVMKRPLYIHFHGGGWHFGTLDTEEPYCMTICDALYKASPLWGVAVLNVNYRHTPEFKFPTQPEDAWTAFSFARDGHLSSTYSIDPERIMMGGTSAGAALAIATGLREMRRIQNEKASPQTKTSVQGLIISSSPAVHPDLFPYSRLRSRATSSYEQFNTTGLLPLSSIRASYGMYLPDDRDETKSHEWVSPLLVSNETLDAALWPATSIHVAGADAFRDEGLFFAAKLQDLGVKVRSRIHAGYPHAFERFPQLEESRKWRDQVVEDIQWFLTHV